MENRVVAHFLSGRVLKGSSFDISPSRPVCHLATRDQGTVAVKLGDLKALFFVKDLQRDPEHHDEQVPASGDPRARGARWLKIRLQGGERLIGLAPVYDETRLFFFVMPVDTNGNNIRVLVTRAASASIEIRPPP